MSHDWIIKHVCLFKIVAANKWLNKPTEGARNLTNTNFTTVRLINLQKMCIVIV